MFEKLLEKMICDDDEIEEFKRIDKEYINDNNNEYLRFLRTQKLIRNVDEIHIIDENKKEELTRLSINFEIIGELE